MLLVDTMQLAFGCVLNAAAPEVLALVGKPYLRAAFLCAGKEDVDGLRMTLADDDRYMGFDDTGFLARYLRERRA